MEVVILIVAVIAIAKISTITGAWVRRNSTDW